jgi:hypothetical protein
MLNDDSNKRNQDLLTLAPYVTAHKALNITQDFGLKMASEEEEEQSCLGNEPNVE